MSIPSEIHINGYYLGIVAMNLFAGFLEWVAQKKNLGAPWCGSSGKYSIAAALTLGPALWLIRNIALFVNFSKRIFRYLTQSKPVSCNDCDDTGFVKFHNPNIRVACHCKKSPPLSN